MRRARIVATLGPASADEATVRALVEAGADVVRLNFSHGTHDDHARSIERVRKVAGVCGRPVPILQDLQGPKIRMGHLAHEPVDLVEGAEICLGAGAAGGAVLPTTYEALADDVHEGDRLLLDDGQIELRVLSVADRAVRCRVVVGGPLKSHKGINLPGIRVSAPSFTEKDAEDLAFGIAHGVDFVAMSFVRSANDVSTVKAAIRDLGGDVPVIAKLERAEAVEALEEILDIADGVMVARGDLGVEMPPERVPVIQKRIISSANRAGVVVITATQMLESMTGNPRPTRAEASDVANAVYDGTDAVMLSGETAAGRYPVASVQMMDRIVRETEASILADEPVYRRFRGRPPLSFPDAVGHAASTAADDVSARAIVAFTRSGATARLISKRRPRTPIIAFTPDERICRQLALWWGTDPRMIHEAEDTDQMIAEVEARLLLEGSVAVGDSLVIMAGAPVTARAETNLLKLHRVGDAR